VNRGNRVSGKHFFFGGGGEGKREKKRNMSIPEHALLQRHVDGVLVQKGLKKKKDIHGDFLFEGKVTNLERQRRVFWTVGGGIRLITSSLPEKEKICGGGGARHGGKKISI